jgi:outer membrane protein TolC
MRELVAALLLAAADAGAPSQPVAPTVAPERAPIPQAAAEKVTLADAVKRALERNPTVAVAVSEIDRAEALIKQSRAAWYPLVTVNGTYTRLDHDRIISSSGQIVASGNQLTANAQITVPIVAARAWAETKHAESTRRIAETSAADVRRQVAQSTARAYLTVVAEHRLIAAVETARSSAKEHFDYAHTRLQGGIGRAIDEVRAAQDLATVERQVQSTYVGLAEAREALGILLAASGPVDSVEQVDLGPVPSLGQALDEARGRRTDVKLLDARVASAKRMNDDLWVFYTPYLTAVGQPFVQEPPTLLNPHFGWQAQLLLTLPLYDGGLRGGIAREREAILAEARTNVEAALRQAAAEVRVSFEAMLRADQALVAARESTRLAHRAYDLATIAYRAGATTNLEVLDAARAARDAETASAQAEDLSRQARLDLLVASGRFP